MTAPAHPPASPEVLDLERAYCDHRQALLGAARRLVGTVDAESVIQEVFVELLRNPGLRARFTGGSLGAWLGEITRRKAMELMRRRGRVLPSEGFEPSSSPEPDLVARDLLRRFLNTRVPRRQHAFFALRFLERRTQIEAAAALGLPRSTLAGWEHRLAEALRRFVVEGR